MSAYYNSILPKDESQQGGNLTGSRTLILAIETSCDETAISIVRSANGHLEILSNEVSSQVKLHAKWGGVVPNLAAREHVKNITPILEMSLRSAGVKIADIDAVAVTAGPGLIPALMVGANFARTLAYLWDKPLIGIHHIEGHIYANFVRANPKSQSASWRTNPKQIQNTKSKIQKKSPSINENCELKIENSLDIKFPILCLVVSGGHTQLVFMRDHFEYEIVGQTVDDAAGEAFDKVARILNIGYPGGPVVAAKAAEFGIMNSEFRKNLEKQFKIQNSEFRIRLPRPMLNKNNFDFSFSGLKTAVLYETKKHSELLKDKNYIAAICHEFQQASVDVLVAKTLKAAQQYQPKTIMLAGGVSANKELREQLGKAIENNLPHVSYSVPELSLTGDNAAMIAAAAAIRWRKMGHSQKKKALDNWKTLQPDANLKLK